MIQYEHDVLYVDMAGQFPNGWSLQGELSSQAEPLRP